MPLVVGTSKGPIETWIDSPPSESLTLGLAGITSHLAINFDLGIGPRLTLSTACASGLHALIRGAMLIREGHARVMVVATESSLHPLFIGSFRRLGVLAPAGHGCRPFDQERRGFVVGEAAAAVCLEKSAENRQGVQVESFAMGADGFHLTGVDPAGGTLRRVLAGVMGNKPVDLIHGHGTGTIMHDPVELAAIDETLAGTRLTPSPGTLGEGRGEGLPSQSSVLSPHYLRNVRPVLYSHKGALGHSIGASGLVATVLNCLCHRHGIVPPNLRTTQPLEMSRTTCSTRAIERRIHRSIVIASGFGGATAAVSLVGGSSLAEILTL